MASHYFTFSTLFFIMFLVGGSQVNARKDGAGAYWRSVMNDEPLPEAINSLMVDVPAVSLSDHKGVHDCETTGVLETKSAGDDSTEPQRSPSSIIVAKFTEEVEAQPQISNYGNDMKLTGKFMRDVEPQPQISNYGDDEIMKLKTKFVREIESSQPQISSYGGNNNIGPSSKFFKDVEPQPQISNYVDDADHMMSRKFAEDFDAQPQISNYDNGVKPNKLAKGINADQVGVEGEGIM